MEFGEFEVAFSFNFECSIECSTLSITLSKDPSFATNMSKRSLAGKLCAFVFHDHPALHGAVSCFVSESLGSSCSNFIAPPRLVQEALKHQPEVGFIFPMPVLFHIFCLKVHLFSTEKLVALVCHKCETCHTLSYHGGDVELCKQMCSSIVP